MPAFKNYSGALPKDISEPRALKFLSFTLGRKECGIDIQKVLEL